MKLSVPDMSCGHCKATVERALTEADPAAKVAVDLETRTVQVESAASLDVLLKALSSVGYDAKAAA